MVAVFPRALLRERSHSWNLVGVTASPGNATMPAAVVRSDGGGFWQCSMNDVSLSGRKGYNLQGKQRQKEATLLWRAVRQIADGGVNPIVVPRNEALFRPTPEGATEVELPHDDDAFFSDGAGYYQQNIYISIGVAAATRATTMLMRLELCEPLIGGEAFAINHPNAGWRMYEIATVEMLDDVYASVRFNPPLREAVSANQFLEFDRPRCTMRLAKSSAMDLTVQPWTFNSGSVEFVEAPW